MALSSLKRARRAIAFARQVPPRQLWRRLALTVRRAVRDRWPARTQTLSAPERAEAPPLPLFAPRAGMIAQDGFTFLGRAVAMAGKVDWTAPSLDSCDQLWRMNLHYMVFLEEVDDARLLALIDEWIAANPPNRPGAWKDSYNAYALSLRVVVWMQQLGARRLTPSSVLASLAGQMRFLEANLETDLGGNHLIKNVKALIWASAYFSGREAARWRRKGLRRLLAELEAQVLPDGVHFERSPSYHAQVFADLLECRHALADSAPPALDEVLRGMAQVCADLAHPDGGPAQFNDSGLTMAYAPGACLAAYARIFKQATAAAPVFAYPEAGYFGRREGGDYFVADAGRIGPDALPAHAHGDVLSFELSVAGSRMIVDPGVYEYIDGERRRASRTAASHNTLCFEGLDQAEFFGAFRCGLRPNVTVRELVCEPERLAFEGAHDGFSPHQHARGFDLTSGVLRIVDRMAGPPRAARIGFLLHPEVEIVVDEAGATLKRGAARVRFCASVALTCEDAVWWPDMGQERPTRRLCLDVAPGTSEVTSEFIWREPAA